MRIVLSLVLCLWYAAIGANATVLHTRHFTPSTQETGIIQVFESEIIVSDSTSSVTFQAFVQCDGEYNLDVWILPAQKNDYSFAQYKVVVNGKVCSTISPNTDGWQYLTADSPIHLNSGLNTISITDIIPNIPAIEHIVVTSSSNTRTPLRSSGSLAYQSFISKISNEAKRDNSYDQTLLNDTIYSPICKTSPFDYTYAEGKNCYYEYFYQLGIKFHYTFYTLVYIPGGQEFHIYSEGVNAFQHVLEIINVNAPNTISLVYLSNGTNNTCCADFTVPESGLYQVRLRSFKNGQAGLCNIDINGYQYLGFTELLKCHRDKDRVIMMHGAAFLRG